MGVFGKGNASRISELESRIRWLESELALSRAWPPTSFDAATDLTASSLYTRQGILRVPSGGMWLHTKGINNDVYLAGGEYPLTRSETSPSAGEWRVEFKEIKLE